MPIFAPSNLKQYKIMEQQKTRTVMKETLNHLKTKVLKQELAMLEEKDKLYGAYYNTIVQMCEEMQGQHLYVDFSNTHDFEDEQYLKQLIRTYRFTDNGNHKTQKITALEYERYRYVKITVKEFDADAQNDGVTHTFYGISDEYNCVDDVDYRLVQTLYAFMIRFVEYYQPLKKWGRRCD